MIKILQCLTHSDTGGGQAAVFTLVKSLIQYYPNLQLSVMLPEGGIFVDSFRAAGVNVITFPLDSLSVTGLFRFHDIVLELNPDVIHSHGKGAGFYSRMLSFLGYKCRRIHTHHGFHIPQNIFQKVLYLFLERNLSARSDVIVAVSSSEGDELRKHFNKFSDRILVIPNVINRNELDKLSDNKLPSDLENFLQASKDKIVLMIARDDPVKNHALALDAAEIVLSRNKNIRFIFVGLNSKNTKYQSLYSRFKNSIYTVEKLETVAPLYKLCSIILLTSKKEGMPLVIQEGFYFGLPAVGTRVSGICDIVEHNVNGILCDETPSSIAEAINKLSSNPVVYQHMQSQAFKVASQMNIESWAKSYSELYSLPKK